MTSPRTAAASALTLILLTAACSTSGTTSTGEPAATSPPPATSAPSSAAPTEAPVDDGEVLGEGDFERIGYRGEGTATLIDTGRRVEVRLTAFDVEEGPALRVYLSTAPAGSPESRYDDDFADLGPLKAFSGDQTYVVPGDTDVDAYRSVVIWCAEFSVGFVVAPLGA